MSQLKHEIYRVIDEIPEEMMDNLYNLITSFKSRTAAEKSESVVGEVSSIDKALAKLGIKVSEIGA